MNMKLGTDLTASQQADALRAFVHRFTGQHKPDWARTLRPNGTAYPVQFADDADWLAHTTFAVNKDGSFNRRVHYCESSPTWPNNPEMRK